MLRPDRLVIEEDGHSYTLSDVAERGVGVCYSTAGSGAVIGDTNGKVTLKVDPSGSLFAGILMNDFVNIDETRYRVNIHKEEQVIGDVARVLRKGWVYTDKLKSGDAPTVGEKAYLTANGTFTKTSLGAIATPLAGEFGGKKDEDGYIKIVIDLPMWN